MRRTKKHARRVDALPRAIRCPCPCVQIGHVLAMFMGGVFADTVIGLSVMCVVKNGAMRTCWRLGALVGRNALEIETEYLHMSRKVNSG